MIDTYYLNILLLVIITLHLLPQFIFDLDRSGELSGKLKIVYIQASQQQGCTPTFFA